MKNFLLFVSDIIVLYLSLVIALMIRYPLDFQRQYGLHIYPFSLIFISWLLVFYIANLYEPKTLRNNTHFYSTLFQAIITASAISVIFFYLIPLYGITPKTNLLIFLVVFTGLEFANRSISNNVLQKSFKKRVLIVGTNNQSLELDLFIKENPQLGYEIKSVMDISSDKLQTISQTIQEEKIDTIVLSPEAYQVPEIIDIFYKSLEQKVSFMNLASFYERLTSRVPLGGINQVWFLENLSEGTKKLYETTKQGCDIFGATIIGIVFLPFYPLIALAIKLSSPGPIFFRQKRVGQGGKIFELIKFRSTPRTTVGSNVGWEKEPADIYTRFGKFMRSIHLDEIPQIINILMGEMSFVGPRPERPEFVDELVKNIPFYQERLLVKPGLTGWAQISIRINASAKDALDKLQYDLYYIKNRSLFLDLGIALQTIRIMFQHSGK